jgi:hypothetical protein
VINRSKSLFSAIFMIALAAPIFGGQAPAQGPPAGGQGQRQGGGGGGAGRGGGRGNITPTNLQVLPKDTPGQQVIQTMQAFTMGLGVQCNYCHAPQANAQPGANGQIPMDFASDEKQTKKTARVMMKMVGDINAKLGSELGKPASDVVQVQCVTCHRGSAIPKLQ